MDLTSNFKVKLNQSPGRAARDEAGGNIAQLRAAPSGQRSDVPAALAAAAGDNRREDDLFKAAQKLEVSFLTELLKYSGFTKGLDTQIGGTAAGQGASAFSSIYINDIAEKIVAAGGIGLAASFYQNLIASGAEHAEHE